MQVLLLINDVNHMSVTNANPSIYIKYVENSYFQLLSKFEMMWIEGAWGMASCGREEEGLTLVKDEVLGLSLVGGDRWGILCHW
jgi:hypothetical protein